MEIFRKEYTLQGALDKLKKDNKNKFTAIPINPDVEDTKYWVLRKNSLEVRKKIETHKSEKMSNNKEGVEVRTNNEYTNKRQEFNNRISGNGIYKNISYQNPKAYNNHQNSKGYRNSIGYDR